MPRPGELAGSVTRGCNRMRFCVLASGSEGNACYVETARARILIDAGLSCREIERRLEPLAVEPGSLDGVLITHEHQDHIRGAGPLARRYDLPVFLNAQAFQRARKMLGSLPRPVIFQTGQTLTLRDLQVDSFTKCHDAVDPIGVVLTCNGIRLGVATDLGRSTRLVEDRLRACAAVILEFNHDLDMLENGPYPLELKRRIRGQDGHLSNRQAAELLRVISHPGLKALVLAHISQKNNAPDKALEAARRVLKRCDLAHVELYLAQQDETGPMIALR